ncbi:MAG: flagellar L-ring protein precursor FlgH [Candidatus Frackibacter sp. T328-2]|nr:MAG: flagellar L-ring protein precursor FlgH [Candidatus Frackibacter sp. T328-2]
MKTFLQRGLVVSLILLCSLVLVTNPLFATSLYSDANSIYTEAKAREAGDILTVIIREQSTATQQANTDTAQSNGLQVGPGGGLLDFIKLIQMDQQDSSSASGSTTRSGNLSAQMTVQVEKVLPNGNLKIHGTKEITINNETQKIELSGIVRPEDISVQNIIDSTKIANGRINYKGNGAIGDKQRPGLLTRLLNWIF